MVNVRMAFVPSYAQGAYFLLVLVLACTSSGYGSIFPTPMMIPPPTAAPKECPLYNTQEGFKLQPVYKNKRCLFSTMFIIYSKMSLSMLNLYNFWVFYSFWVTGTCWSTSIINQCGWRISVASDFISLWLVLVNYNRISHFVFLPWRVIFITFQPFLWSVIKTKQSGIRNSEEVSHILKTNYMQWYDLRQFWSS